jgi:hypothetical protein
MNHKPMTDIEDLKTKVRTFLSAEKWSVNRFAKAADITHSTIQNILTESWNPRTDTLQACLDVVERNLIANRPLSPRPVHHRIPTSLLDRGENLFFKNCVEIWETAGKNLTPDFLHQLDDVGAQGRWSDIYVGPDNRLRIANYGPDAFGKRFQASDSLLMDMPQRDLFEWVETRVWEILMSGSPEFSSCVAPTRSIIGSYDVPYTALVLPCSSRTSGPVDSVVSITRLEPSEYRDRISLLRTTTHAA